MDPCNPKTNISIARAAVMDTLFLNAKEIDHLSQTDLCKLLTICRENALPYPPLMKPCRVIGKYRISVSVISPLNAKDYVILLGNPTIIQLKKIAEKVDIFYTNENRDNLRKFIINRLIQLEIPEPIKEPTKSHKVIASVSNVGFNNLTHRNNSNSQRDNNLNRQNNVNNLTHRNNISNSNHHNNNNTKSPQKLINHHMYMNQKPKNNTSVAVPYLTKPIQRLSVSQQNFIPKQVQTYGIAPKGYNQYRGSDRNRYKYENERRKLDNYKRRLQNEYKRANQSRMNNAKKTEFAERMKKLANMEKQYANKLKLVSAPVVVQASSRAPVQVPGINTNKFKQSMKTIETLQTQPRNAQAQTQMQILQARQNVLNVHAVTLPVIISGIADIRLLPENKRQQAFLNVSKQVEKVAATQEQKKLVETIKKISEKPSITESEIASIETQTKNLFNKNKINKFTSGILSGLGGTGRGIMTGVSAGTSKLFTKKPVKTIANKRTVLNRMLNNSSLTNEQRLKILAVRNLSNLPNLPYVANVERYYKTRMENANFKNISEMAKKYGGLRGSMSNLRRQAVNGGNTNLVTLIDRFQKKTINEELKTVATILSQQPNTEITKTQVVEVLTNAGINKASIEEIIANINNKASIEEIIPLLTGKGISHRMIPNAEFMELVSKKGNKNPAKVKEILKKYNNNFRGLPSVRRKAYENAIKNLSAITNSYNLTNLIPQVNATYEELSKTNKATANSILAKYSEIYKNILKPNSNKVNAIRSALNEYSNAMKKKTLKIEEPLNSQARINVFAAKPKGKNFLKVYREEILKLNKNKKIRKDAIIFQLSGGGSENKNIKLAQNLIGKHEGQVSSKNVIEILNTVIGFDGKGPVLDPNMLSKMNTYHAENRRNAPLSTPYGHNVKGGIPMGPNLGQVTSLNLTNHVIRQTGTNVGMQTGIQIIKNELGRMKNSELIKKSVVEGFVKRAVKSENAKKIILGAMENNMTVGLLRKKINDSMKNALLAPAGINAVSKPAKNTQSRENKLRAFIDKVSTFKGESGEDYSENPSIGSSVIKKMLKEVGLNSDNASVNKLNGIGTTRDELLQILIGKPQPPPGPISDSNPRPRPRPRSKKLNEAKRVSNEANAKRVSNEAKEAKRVSNEAKEAKRVSNEAKVESNRIAGLKTENKRKKNINSRFLAESLRKSKAKVDAILKPTSKNNSSTTNVKNNFKKLASEARIVREAKALKEAREVNNENFKNFKLEYKTNLHSKNNLKELLISLRNETKSKIRPKVRSLITSIGGFFNLPGIKRDFIKSQIQKKYMSVNPQQINEFINWIAPKNYFKKIETTSNEGNVSNLESEGEQESRKETSRDKKVIEYINSQVSIKKQAAQERAEAQALELSSSNNNELQTIVPNQLAKHFNPPQGPNPIIKQAARYLKAKNTIPLGGILSADLKTYKNKQLQDFLKVLKNRKNDPKLASVSKGKITTKINEIEVILSKKIQGAMGKTPYEVMHGVKK